MGALQQHMSSVEQSVVLTAQSALSIANRSAAQVKQLHQQSPQPSMPHHRPQKRTSSSSERILVAESSSKLMLIQEQEGHLSRDQRSEQSNRSEVQPPTPHFLIGEVPPQSSLDEERSLRQVFGEGHCSTEKHDNSGGIGERHL